MTVALSLPHEDETLFSVIGRYNSEFEIPHPRLRIERLFGRRFTQPNTYLIEDLSTFSRQTYPAWQLSAMEIAARLTAFPYYLKVLGERERLFARESIVRKQTHSLTLYLGIQSTVTANRGCLKFCERCATEDIARYGEAHWRRAHQLPGVFFCAKHATPLKNSEAPVMQKSWQLWRSAHGFIVSAKSLPYAAPVSCLENEHLVEIAKRSKTALDTELSPTSFKSRAEYFARAQDLGLVRRNGLIVSDTVRREMNDMYGAEYLAAVGLPIYRSPGSMWTSGMLLHEGRRWQPLHHILLDYYLDQRAKSYVRAAPASISSIEQFTCPAFYARHGPHHPIEEVIKRTSPDGTFKASAVCSCGMKFAFSECMPGSTVPKVKELLRTPDNCYDVVKGMKESGLSNNAIAHALGLSLSTIAHTIGKWRPVENVTNTLIRKWRREWLELLVSVAPEGHKQASSLNPKLYRDLRVHDSAWLEESAKRTFLAVHAGKPGWVDWNRRDRLWSAQMRQVANRLKLDDTKSIRVTRTLLIREIGVYPSDRTVELKLPLCGAVIDEVSESREEFRIRRIRKVVRKLVAEGRPVTEGLILKHVGINRCTLTPTESAEVSRLAMQASLDAAVDQQ